MVTIIIPSYNYGHLIADTIRSVQQQSYTDWEMIIVDDGSGDNTAEVVQDFINQDKRIQFYRQENAGPSAARNLALQKAKGDYIQFLDADDCIEERKFEIQLRAFTENPQSDIVYGTVRYFKKNPYNKDEYLFTYWGKNKEWMPGIQGYGKDILIPALKGSFAHISCFLFKREIIDKAGKWDVGKRAAEDYLFVLNCVLQNAYFLYEDAPGSYALVRWHENNVSRNVKWIHQGEIKMRMELRERLAGLNNAAAVETNENSIKALEMMTEHSWRKIFLSGGAFDFIKPLLRKLKIDRFIRNVFYKRMG